MITIIEDGQIVAVPCRFCPDTAEMVDGAGTVFECPTCGFRYDARGREIPED